MVLDPEHTYAQVTQLFVPHTVIRRTEDLCMPRAIEFDRQAFGRTVEVEHDGSTDAVLSSELEAVESLCPQQGPQRIFCRCRSRSEATPKGKKLTLVMDPGHGRS